MTQLVVGSDKRTMILLKFMLAMCEAVHIFGMTKRGSVVIRTIVEKSPEIGGIYALIEGLSYDSLLGKTVRRAINNPLQRGLIDSFMQRDQTFLLAMNKAILSARAAFPEAKVYDFIAKEFILYAPALRIGYDHWSDLMDGLDLIYGHEDRLRIKYKEIV